VESATPRALHEQISTVAARLVELSLHGHHQVLVGCARVHHPRPTRVVIGGGVVCSQFARSNKHDVRGRRDPFLALWGKVLWQRSTAAPFAGVLRFA
jgi:hypothetical protein